MSKHDFDFLHGSWRISHQIRKALTGPAEWQEFSTQTSCRPVLGGYGNIDEGEFSDHGYHAMALRLYDEKQDAWSIYWATSRGATIDPPMTGRFADGEGEFFGPETYDGNLVMCRFRWTDITPDSCRWAQALSTDGGTIWVTNWVMDFNRI